MTNPTQRRLHSRRGSWCCSFIAPPTSPENPKPKHKPTPGHHHHHQYQLTKHDNNKFINSNSSLSSIPNSPQMSKFVPRIDPRRILSPGRVSPIDSVPSTTTVDSIHHSITAVDFLHSAKPKSISSSLQEHNSSSSTSSSSRWCVHRCFCLSRRWSLETHRSLSACIHRQSHPHLYCSHPSLATWPPPPPPLASVQFEIVPYEKHCGIDSI
ncbi:hypothetical protein ACFE04_008182 [Oxalis oulophora]